MDYGSIRLACGCQGDTASPQFTPAMTLHILPNGATREDTGGLTPPGMCNRGKPSVRVGKTGSASLPARAPAAAGAAKRVAILERIFPFARFFPVRPRSARMGLEVPEPMDFTLPIAPSPSPQPATASTTSRSPRTPGRWASPCSFLLAGASARLLGHHRPQVACTPAGPGAVGRSSWRPSGRASGWTPSTRPPRSWPARPSPRSSAPGYVELSKLTGRRRRPPATRPCARSWAGSRTWSGRSRRAAVSEITDLEAPGPVPGHRGAAAPFVGPVRHGLGHHEHLPRHLPQGNANLATVARPIGEALIATAVGLFAAIPAVVAYNSSSSRSASSTARWRISPATSSTS